MPTAEIVDTVAVLVPLLGGLQGREAVLKELRGGRRGQVDVVLALDREVGVGAADCVRGLVWGGEGRRGGERKVVLESDSAVARWTGTLSTSSTHQNKNTVFLALDDLEGM